MNTTTTSATPRSTTNTSIPFARGAMLAGKRIEHWRAASHIDDIMLAKPLHWTKPRHILSGDLFAEGVPDEWIDRVFAVMALAPQHIFLVLSKRAVQMRDYFAAPDLFERLSREILTGKCTPGIEAGFGTLTIAYVRPWPLPNVWLGVSVEDQTRADERIPELLATPAARRFISAEPLLGPIRLPNGRCRRCGHINAGDGLAREGCGRHELADRLDWVIAGGESGPGARPMLKSWATSLRDQCAAGGILFFFKQWGEWTDADEWLAILRMRGIALARDEGDTLNGGWQPQAPLRFDAAADLAAACNQPVRPYQHHSDGTTLIRVGKAAAGRLLDGREWSEFPA